MEENIQFQSYSWSIGTTSFRVSELNYKIEKQLQLLSQFWEENPSLKWDEDTQKKYYYLMRDSQFLTGEANWPSKDAREKTSGLVDIGVLTPNRMITDVGKKVLSLIDRDISKDNIFQIPEDSYIYLLQMLKLQYKILMIQTS